MKPDRKKVSGGGFRKGLPMFRYEVPDFRLNMLRATSVFSYCDWLLGWERVGRVSSKMRKTDGRREGGQADKEETRSLLSSSGPPVVLPPFHHLFSLSSNSLPQQAIKINNGILASHTNIFKRKSGMTRAPGESYASEQHVGSPSPKSPLSIFVVPCNREPSFWSQS